ncbi:fimbrillin family protein [Bacteroides sp. KG68]|uniref:fimbrillin family protein n=1 Tax=unclassified Bacteroides TaxID=2646097 RepID=UPI003D97A4B4
MRKKYCTDMLAAGAAALLLTMIPTGCTDEREENPSTEGRIGFAVDFRQEGQTEQAAQTKSARTTADTLPADTLPAVSVIALEGDASEDGKALYLHATITDGIGTGTEESAAGEAVGTDARTKAAPVDNATMYGDMSVTAFVYPTAQSWPAAFEGKSATIYMRTVKVKKSEGWSTSYNWPGSTRRISFFAVAPYDSPGLTRLTDVSGSTLPFLSYAVPAKVTEQKDLLVAASTDRPGNGTAAELLTMRHALTAVRFVTGDEMLSGTVSKITLKNVYGAGKLPLQASAAWYGHSNKTNFEQTLSPEAVAPDPQVPGTKLTQADATFMMMPQTLPTDAKIEVIYKDKLTNKQRTLTATIKGEKWPMGKTVIYRISTGSIAVTPTLEVTAPAESSYKGGNGTYTVKSYVSVSDGKSTANAPMAWEAEFSENGGSTWSSTPPKWLTAFTKQDGGSTSAKSYTVTVAAQTSTTTNPHTAALRKAAQVTNYDLSTKGNTTKANTANCYIVNAPGSYRLPLVYGNAIKNGETNSPAYTSTARGEEVLNPFINHSGQPILGPNIYDSHAVHSCTLLWQDGKNLVTNVRLSSDKHFLEFTVDKANIRQGNAVVTVRDASNTILWSWHIWVTDYKPGTSGTTAPDKEITNHQGKKYKIMSYNLGWCDGEKKTYAERTVQVRFKQKPTAGYTPVVTKIITLKQKAHAIVEPGNNTYYQWGRKDPFVGAIFDILTRRNKTWYDANGNVKTNQLFPVSSFSTGDDCIKSSITNPNTFCTNYSMDQKYVNLWSVNNNGYASNDDLVVKTIYDPCPAGYKMPPGNAFTGFTTTGENTNNSSQFNVSGEFNNGWNFHCGLNKTGDTVFFPATSWRHYNDAVLDLVGSNARYWSAVPNSKHEGWNLGFSPAFVNPLDSKYRGIGSSVRPIQE